MDGRNTLLGQGKALNFLDCFCAALLALCPLLQHYKGLLYNSAITVLIFVSVYLIIKMIKEVPTFKFSKISFVFVMIVYQLYRIINHGTTVTEIGQSGVVIVFMLAVALGQVNIKFMLKVARIVCVIAACCLILQYISFYLFDYHIQFAPTSLFTSNAKQWTLAAQTGLAGVTGKIGTFYRPSAFFLEPAHVYIYTFPHIILTLFGEKFNFKTAAIAAIISLGVVLSTSGMGIAAVVGIWAIFFAIRNEKDGSFSFKNIFRKRNLIAIGFLLVAFIILVFSVPFLKRAILRIFVPSATGYTAISGRMKNALKLISKMTPLQWISGVADNSHNITSHIPGFIDPLYRHGIIGLVLSYELYVKCTVKLKFPYNLIGAVILITSLFSAHTHSTVGMLNFLLILMCGFQDIDQKFIAPYKTNDSNSIFGKLFKK